MGKNRRDDRDYSEEHDDALNKIVDGSCHISADNDIDCGEQCHYDDADAVVNGKCHGEQTGKTVVKRCGVGNHENKDNNSGDDLEIL